MKFLYRCNRGLGDHIICKGIYNQIPKEYDEVIVITDQECYKPSLKHLYDSRSFILTKEEFDDLCEHHYLDEITEKDCLLSGFEWINRFDKFRTKWIHHYSNGIYKTFLEQFYAQVKLNPEISWTKFSIDNRDISEENRILNLYKNKKIFLHDDFQRGYIIKNEYKIGKDYIFPDKNITDNIFNWVPFIQQCEEIHVIDSCFLNLIDRIDINSNAQLYLHDYAKRWEVPTLKKNWTIIKE